MSIDRYTDAARRREDEARETARRDATSYLERTGNADLLEILGLAGDPLPDGVCHNCGAPLPQGGTRRCRRRECIGLAVLDRPPAVGESGTDDGS